MLFSSLTFLFVFLPIVLIFYYITPRNYRNLFLLLASLFFYAWGEVFYILVMLFSIIFNYAIGLLVDWKRKTRLPVVIGVCGNLALLSVFKYANFLTDNLNAVLSIFQLSEVVLAPVHLPIGISFFTFQAMSYVIDVHNRKTEVQKNLLDLGLYIALFPQLIAGPIIRYHDIFQQIKSRKEGIERFAQGVERFIIGLGKKVLIANVLAVPADKIFALGSTDLTSGLAWLGLIAYALQIYFDFSGYSDMAIGLGKMFGFDFPENFNFPYISRSVREFWRRWHMSLSQWFRDYLYIPLGGNRLGEKRTCLNLMIVFLLVGLWHGASWNFVIWGALHGCFIVLERFGLDRVLEKPWKPLQHLYLLFIVISTWVFFRIETFTESMTYFAALFGFSEGTGVSHFLAQYVDNEVRLALFLGVLFSTDLPKKIFRLKFFKQMNTEQNPSSSFSLAIDALKMGATFFVFFMSIVYLAAGTYNPFIYFRF